MEAKGVLQVRTDAARAFEPDGLAASGAVATLL